MGAETKSESLGETPPEAVLDKSEHSEYPPKKAVIPALIAGYLVVFLVALVWTCVSKRAKLQANTFPRIEPSLERQSHQ